MPLERLPHIERDDAAAADHFRLRAALEQHLRRIGATPEKATPAQRAEAVTWFVREVAFTHLNRLVALKCLEARGLIPEIITTRDAYGGRSRAHYEYRFDHPAEAAAPDDALPAAIRHVCRIVYGEFRLLFDVGDPAAGRKPPADDIVWPAYPVLRDCIALINGLDVGARHSLQNSSLATTLASGTEPAAAQDSPGNASPLPDSLWLEDEIIGWIYQFYNAEQKEAIRDRGAPQRPAEVAVINQFFTPRWIVKFLVDNTLGRLWLEMHPDSSAVRAKCDYLVPEPLGEVDKETRRQGEGEKQFALDPDSPINNPKAPSRRKAKRPEEIRLIDPACGAMHFGHYAFEVFQAIYQDYYELYAHDESANQRISESEIPAAILRYNLYGVDIDLRAVQLAALSLFIKAKSADPNAHITRMNLVVADAVLPADGVRTQFLDRYKDDKAVQDAVRQVLDEMANVAEVGSLLRVEERLRAILAKAGHRAGEETARLDPRTQRPLPGIGGKGGQLALVDLPEAQPEDWGAHYTVARLLDDLREFAARALQTHDLNAQLFAEEAEKSVHLLDVFLNDYDVAVMNPPFGGTLAEAGTRLEHSYKALCGNLLCGFVERAVFDLAPQGFIGAVLDRTFLLKMSFEQFRKDVLLDHASLLAFTDLGWGVLDDANVEVSTLVASAQQIDTPAVFLRGRAEVQTDVATVPLNRMQQFVVPMSDFRSYPNASFAYWTPASIRRMFRRFPSLDPEVCAAKEGIHPNDAERFLRSHWEVSLEQVGRRHKWVPVANGGGYSPFYRDNQSLILYEDEAAAIKSLRGMRNEHLQFREGLTWGKRTDLVSFQYLPTGHAFTHEGHSLFPHDSELIWELLSTLNSSLMRYTANTLCGQHKTSGYIGQLPYSPPDSPLSARLRSTAKEAYDFRRFWDTGNEICTRFDASWLIQARRGALLGGTTADGRPLTAALDLPDLPVSQSTVLPALLDHLLVVEHAVDARLQQLQAEIDDAVYELYEITAEDRALIERELGDRPSELVWPQMAGKADDEKRREHVRRLVSWCLLNALREKRDGILPVTPVAGEFSALDAVRGGLEAEFGEAAAFRVESGIGQVLGQSLADWLDGPFIKWHTQLYKRRPIVWHLASPRNAFGCFLYIHKLDADTLRKVQTLYLWPRRRGVEAERDEALRARAAGDRAASRRLEAAEALLDDLAEFEKRLLSVIQAQVKCEIPDWAEGPFRDGVYDPVLDDGVKVNITPLQEAGVLRYGKVV